MIFNKDIFEQAKVSYMKRNGFNEFCPKAALIDMDGVLYDSMPKHAEAWYKLSMELGLICKKEEFFLYEGMTGYATINLLFKRAFGREVSREEAAELYKRKAAYFVELGEPEMMPGAMQMLQHLKENGIERVLVTGSGQKSVLDRISHDYPGLFAENMRITAHDVEHGKPNPEPYLKGLEKAGVKANEAIVIENAPLGVEAGSGAHCFTIGLTTGPVPEKDLRDSGADLIFPSMNDFATSIDMLIKLMR